MMIRPFVEAVRTFKSKPFRSSDLVEKLGYSAGYARNFLSQATRQGLLVREFGAGKRDRIFKANPAVVRGIVLKGGKAKEDLLSALGLHSKYHGEYVALRGFSVVAHDLDLSKLGERVFSNRGAEGEIVITSIGVPKKIITVEI